MDGRNPKSPGPLGKVVPAVPGSSRNCKIQGVSSVLAGTTVLFGIPKKLRSALARSNRWGRVRCEVTYAMTSKYAIALYELVCLRINLHTCVERFTIDRFRELVGVPPNAYADGQDFRRKVIEPAVLEVNRLSDLHVDIDLVRKHPRAAVHEVIVAWRKQEGDEFRASSQERHRSKVGRKARLRGQVQVVVPEALDSIA
jgi:hypothetical protein